MKYIGKCTPAWSILERNFQQTIEEKNNILFSKNGPGLYDLSETDKYKYKQNPKWTLGKKLSQKDLKKNEEENLILQSNIQSNRQTQNQKDFKKRSKSQTTFGFSKRFKNLNKNNLVPAPDTYNLNSCFKNFKKLNCNLASRNYKSNSLLKNIIEPPIQYDIVNTNWNKGKKVYFKQYNNQPSKTKSQDKKSLSIKKTKKSIKRGQTIRCNSTFGTQKRLKNQKTHQAPINYDVEKLMQYYKKDKHYSFGKKQENKISQSNRCFSKYYNYDTYNIKKNIGCSFGLSERFKKDDKENIDINLITSNQNDLNLKQKKKGHGFGKGVRLQVIDDQNPGPGSYLIPSQFAQKTKEQNICYPVISLKQKENVPGPGAYNPSLKYKDKKGCLVFGEKFKRKFKQSCDKFYDTQTKIGTKGCSFGKSKRFKRKKRNVETGPEFYELKSTIPQLQPWLNCYVDDQFILTQYKIKNRLIQIYDAISQQQIEIYKQYSNELKTIN